MTNQDENLDDIISSLIDVDEEETSPNKEEKQELTGEPVTLTERASKQVKTIIEKEGLDDNLFLRVAVEGGGCSGLSYKLGLDYRTEDDVVFENYGVEVIVASKHLMYLEGIEIDYPDGLDARGFTFDNPNSVEDCGCGTSFSI
ncbi:MAG: iron-sulfur cluster assembly accessory protein [Balneola sp.]|nr:iron-sulfur cluster assembly accessory protein [Balneola sp.]MBO6650630.1 iron-sulfur cluster assembly accessory protein [Balneola sp.]MBO6712591.1 iron-sulfur cluster assembly accessory protein [Balneola sp.]MBO6800915.1 iron-sulfur cluster assembly accessory protein [Balneola sp.]MBO6870588.1 iron-sulfur cluster assembly accessory protein [Balneola sp.]